MKQQESPPSFVGHVKNGIVVLDVQVSLAEGQAVRIEPIDPQSKLDADRAERVSQLKRLFTDWTDEDGKLSDEEADRLHTALEQHRGLSFRAHVD